MINRKVNITELLILRVKTENMNKLLTFSQAFLVSFQLRIEDLFTGYWNSRSRRLAEQQLVSSWFMSKNSSMQRWCISYETWWPTCRTFSSIHTQTIYHLNWPSDNAHTFPRHNYLTKSSVFIWSTDHKMLWKCLNSKADLPLTRWRRFDFAITCISHRP